MRILFLKSILIFILGVFQFFFYCGILYSADTDSQDVITASDGTVKEISGFFNGEKVYSLEFYKNGAKYIERRFKNILMSDTYTKWYENGNIMKTGYYTRGKPSGKWTDYDEMSNKKWEIEYFPDTEVSSQTTFHINGEIKETGFLLKKQKIGLWRIWDKYCNLFEERNYTGQGDECYYTEYFSNGKKKRAGLLKNNKLHSCWTFWDDSGNIDEQSFYKEGKKDGSCTKYYTTGAIQYTGNYSDNKRCDTWLWYYNGGEKQIYSFLKNDKFQGLWTKWYANGEKLEEGYYDDSGAFTGYWYNWNDKGDTTDIVYFTNESRVKFYLDGEKKEEYFIKDGKKYGSCKEWYQNGNMKLDCNMKYDNLDGYCTSWYENGKLKSVAFYVKNKFEGPRREYYENGNLKISGNYQAGKNEGEYVKYGDAGNTICIENFRFGKRNGLEIKWLPKYFNKKKSEGEYIGGKKNGLWTFWSWTDTGELESIKNYTFENNIKSGQYLKKNKDGKTLEIGNYKNDELDGILYGFYETGEPSFEIEYSNGKKNGKFIRLYKNGQKEREGQCSEEEEEGVWMKWYENGKIKEQKVYRRGKLDGLYTYWNEDGIKNNEGYMKNDERDGISVFYYDTGETEQIAQFTDGKKNGVVSAYYKNGIRYALINFKDDVIDGEMKKWHTNGQLAEEAKYSDGIELNSKKWDMRGNEIGDRSNNRNAFFSSASYLSSVIIVNGKATKKMSCSYPEVNLRISNFPETCKNMSSGKKNAENEFYYYDTNSKVYIKIIPIDVGLRVKVELKDIYLYFRNYLEYSAKESLEYSNLNNYNFKGITGINWEGTVKSAEKLKYYRCYFIINNGFAYQFVFYSQVSNSEEVFEYSQNIMDSIDFIDSSAFSPLFKRAGKDRYESKKFGYSIENTRDLWIINYELKEKIDLSSLVLVDRDDKLISWIIPLALNGLPVSLTELSSLYFKNMSIEFPGAEIKVLKQDVTDSLEWIEYEYKKQVAKKVFTYRVRIIKNNFFGYAITCSGLSRDYNEKKDLIENLFLNIKFDTDINSKIMESNISVLKDTELYNFAFQLNELGIEILNKNDPERAVKFFKKAFSYNRHNSVFLQNAVEAYARAEDYKTALEFLEENLQQFEDDPAILKYYASLLVKTDEAEEAEKVIKKLIGREPDNEDAILLYADMLWDSDEQIKALNEVKNFTDKHKTYKALQYLSSIYSALENYDSSLVVLEEMQSSWPLDTTIEIEIIKSLQNKEMYEKSLELCKQFIDKVPGNAVVYYYKGINEFYLDKLKNAKDSLAKSIEIDPDFENAVKFYDIIINKLGQGNNTALKNYIEPVQYAACQIFQEYYSKKTDLEYISDYHSHNLLLLKAAYFKKGVVSKESIRKIIRVTDIEGVENFNELVFDYNPKYENLHVNYLRIYDNAGETVTVASIDNYYVTDKKNGNISNEEQEARLPVPSLMPGYYIDVMITKEKKSKADFSFDNYYLFDRTPVISSKYSINGDIPLLKYYFYNIEPSILSDTELRIELSNAPILHNENYLPELQTFMPAVIVADSSSWELEIKDYLEKLLPYINDTQLVSVIADSIIAGCNTDEEKAIKLARYVQSNFTYLALEFGGHAKIPNKIETILHNKYGDCKDVSLFLYTLLKYSGIRAQLALANTYMKIN